MSRADRSFVRRNLLSRYGLSDAIASAVISVTVLALFDTEQLVRQVLVATALALVGLVGSVFRALIEPGHHTPAPAHLTRQADQLAVTLGLRPIRLVVGNEVQRIAVLKGFWRSARIEISPVALTLPERQLFAVIAHEYGHLLFKHRMKHVAHATLSAPVIHLCAIGVTALVGNHLAVSAAVSAVTSVLFSWHRQRLNQIHELHADSIIAALPGSTLRKGLLELLDEETPSHSRWGSHPAAHDRREQLTERQH